MDDGNYGVKHFIVEESALYDFDLYLALWLVIQTDHPVKDAVCIIPALHMAQEVSGCYRRLFLIYFHGHIAQVGTDEHPGGRSATGDRSGKQGK